MLGMIVNIAGWVLLGLGVIALVPACMFCVEVVACVLIGPRRAASGGPRPSVGVLIPAHNEELMLGDTLRSVRAQLVDGDRVLVVADNCSDATADIAREHGAEVLERFHETDRGKGFALDAGIRWFEEGRVEDGDTGGTPVPRGGEEGEGQSRGLGPARLPADDVHPEVVLIVDADCALGDGTLDALARQVGLTGRPAQAVYLMDPPEGGGVRDRISALAFRFKNLVRPIGLDRLGGACLLTGSGMALAWEAAAGAKLASGNIVEDMQLGLDMAIDGRGPRVCPAARVTSQLPGEDDAKATQRTRWEHGHLSSIFKHAIPMIGKGIATPRWELLLLGLELAVPPTSLLVMGTVVLAGLSAVAWALGGTAWAAAVCGLALLLVGCGFLLGWFVHGRGVLAADDLPGVAWYAVSKLPIYTGAVFKRQSAWVRTKREGE